MSVLYLCKLLSLNIWVAKLKRRLFYIFLLTLTQTYEGNLCFTRLNNFANNSKKTQKLTRFLSGSLFFYTFCQFLQVDYYFLRTENFTNTCQRARVCEHCHDCRSNFSIQVAGPCEGWARNVTVLPWKIKYKPFNTESLAGLSLRAGGRGFPLATQSMAPGNFRR